MQVRPSILIIESNRGHGDLIEEKFRSAFPKAKIHKTRTLADANATIQQTKWDVVVINSRLPDGRGTDFLASLSAEQPFAAVVILTEDPMEEMDATLSHQGVVEFMTKDRQTLESFATRMRRLMETSSSIYRMLRGQRATTTAHSTFRDPLTQAYTRAYFDESLKREVSRANRNRHDLCVLIADVDHMDSINRMKGRKTGDQCLKKLSQTLLRSVRTGDIVARFASDKFVVLIPQCSRADGVRCATRVLNRLKPQARAGHFTVSIGIVHYQGVSKIVRPERIVREASQALSQAKSRGGNRYAA